MNQVLDLRHWKYSIHSFSDIYKYTIKIYDNNTINIFVDSFIKIFGQ